MRNTTVYEQPWSCWDRWINGTRRNTWACHEREMSLLAWLQAFFFDPCRHPPLCQFICCPARKGSRAHLTFPEATSTWPPWLGTGVSLCGLWSWTFLPTDSHSYRLTAFPNLSQQPISLSSSLSLDSELHFEFAELGFTRHTLITWTLWFKILAKTKTFKMCNMVSSIFTQFMEHLHGIWFIV